MALTNHVPLLEQQDQSLPDWRPSAHLRGLVQQAKTGDSDAFARLYRMYADRVYEYMHFHIGDNQTAEDLTARVFLKAWRSVPCYEPGRPPFGVWLYLIARNALLEYSRKRGGRAVAEIVSPEDEGLAPFANIGPCEAEVDRGAERPRPLLPRPGAPTRE